MRADQRNGARAGRRHLIVAMTALLLTAASTPATAEDAEVFDPTADIPADRTTRPPGRNVKGPASKSPADPQPAISGIWTMTQTCADFSMSGSVEIRNAGPSGIEGRIFNASNGIDSILSGGALKGSSIRFDNTYSFLGKHVELWTGTVSASGTRITGTLTGFAANDCRFSLSR